jgi:hypothetical protein
MALTFASFQHRESIYTLCTCCWRVLSGHVMARGSTDEMCITRSLDHSASLTHSLTHLLTHSSCTSCFSQAMSAVRIMLATVALLSVGLGDAIEVTSPTCVPSFCSGAPVGLLDGATYKTIVTLVKNGTGRSPGDCDPLVHSPSCTARASL